MYSQHLHFHFTGIGGSGMSGIAEILLNSGFKVSGTDLKFSQICSRLVEKGASIKIGHKPEHIPESASLLVRSSAVALDNPEVLEAGRRAIPIVRRAEVLAELMRLKFGVAVGGSHGKTTTTSMLGAILEEGELDPTVIIGGIVKAHGSGARLGNSDFLIAESDESDRSFLLLKPTIAVVTNIDGEHLNAYESLKELEESFEKFVNAVPFYGLSVLCIDDKRVRDMANRYQRRKITYGMSPDADIRAEVISQEKNSISYKVYQKEEKLAELTLPMPGKHLMLNSLAAIAVALEFSVPIEKIKSALEKFEGVGRRSEILGEKAGVTVIDDYGHHPTEIRSTLDALATGWKDAAKRILVVFQPHRYSRTRDCFADFLTAFQSADKVFISEIYSAGEAPIKGISGEKLAGSIQGVPVTFASDLKNIEEKLMEEVRAGDLVVYLGAGTVSTHAREFYKNLPSGCPTSDEKAA